MMNLRDITTLREDFVKHTKSKIQRNNKTKLKQCSNEGLEELTKRPEQNMNVDVVPNIYFRQVEGDWLLPEGRKIF
ncbi:hypothetical protein BY996DRAFT_6571999 [Phakopsora pachyrhizi]|nr:hypothetical protein BY996DRAFT_6571999 [Phakopsora pachyrhizi]